MDAESVELTPFRQVLSQVPASARLNVLRRALIPEIENLGYELAHLFDARTVASVFILANETDDRMKRVQSLLDNHRVAGAAPSEANNLSPGHR